MSMLNIEPKVYDDGRTKQSFKDECDINKLLKKAATPNALAHLMKYPAPVYGEFEGYDLLEAHRMVNKANHIFSELPSEVRNEFNGDALAFAKFASDPRNNKRLGELLPAIAKPGDYFPNPVRRPQAAPEPTAAPGSSEPSAAPPEPQATPEAAPASSTT